MFNPTKAHEKQITDGQYKLRMGSRVPTGAANLAYSSVTPLTPSENIRISDNSSFVLENVTAGKQVDLFMWPSETFLLENETGTSDVYSQTFMLTDVFKDDVPLYYVHRLRYFHFDANGPDEHGIYTGTTIMVLDESGNKVQDDKIYQVKLIASNIDKLYYVDVYTNFKTKPGEDYKIIYNAIEIYESGERNIMTNHTERLNAKPSFTPTNYIDDIMDVANKGLPLYYKSESVDFGYSKIYTTERPFKDTRKPVVFRYRIKVIIDKNGVDTYLYSPWIDAKVYNVKSLIDTDPVYYNGFLHLSDESAEEIVASYLEDDIRATWLNDYNCEYIVESNNPDVILDVKPDGKEAVIATTTADTGNVITPISYRIYKQFPFIQFQIVITLRNKTTGELFNALTTDNHTLQSGNGPVDLRVLTLNQLKLPDNFNASEWEVLLDASKNNIPVTLSFYDRDEERLRYPLEATKLSNNTSILIRGDSHYSIDMFTPKYAVRPMDNMQIEVLKPLATGSNENWYVRIQNGRFQKSYVDENNLPQGYGYFVPEYYTQGFSDEYGMPYRFVENEVPQVVGERVLKLRYAPLFITTDPVTNNPDNIQVFVNDVELGIKSWDSASGTLEMTGAVRETDNINVHYYYQETCYEYRGYYNATEGRFIYLDLNPGPGHYSTQWDEKTGMYNNLPSYSLLNKTIYIYLRTAGEMTNITQKEEKIELTDLNEYTLDNPALQFYTPLIYTKYGGEAVKNVNDETVEDGEPTWEFLDEGYVSSRLRINNPKELTNDYYVVAYSYIGSKYTFKNGAFQRNVLHHQFFEINEPNSILLAQVQVRPNSTYENVVITDTRTRGGGIDESIGKHIMQDICPEAMSYWDIGYWDGEPYQENSVMVVRLPRYVLKDFGGRLSKEEVEEAVKKHMALGTFYIIEYEDDPVALLEVPSGLVAESVELDDLKPPALPTPEFELIVEG